MSIPYRLAAASESSSSAAVPIYSKKVANLTGTTAENIRERLNMHVKKRIQGLDIVAPYPVSSSPSASSLASHLFSANSLTSSLKPTHPFLMTGGPGSMAPMMVFENTLLKSTNDYNNGNERAVIVPQIERKQSKTKQQSKSQIKKKKTTANKKTLKHIDAIQAENLIVNTKYSEDESNECMDRSDMMYNSSPQMNQLNADSPPIPSDKQDQKLANTPDILSMVLSLKKNALMHDPYVIQFISSIR